MRHTGNYMLDAMSSDLFASVMVASQLCALSPGSTLLRAGAEPRRLVFMTAGIACTTVVLQNGTATQVALAGPEGLVGFPSLLSSEPSTVSCTMQTSGMGIATSRRHLQHLFGSSEEFRNLILPYVRYQTDLATNVAVCAIRHQAEARIVRWLLEACDRLGDEAVTVTQECLGQAVGVCRTTVAALAAELQRHEYIRYSRGTIKLTNRPGLESRTCECYAVCRDMAAALRRSRSTELQQAA